MERRFFFLMGEITACLHTAEEGKMIEKRRTAEAMTLNSERG